MKRLRILADDLTGALDCAAAFGSGVPVHLGRPADLDAPGLDVVATATRDVDPATLAEWLGPCVPWLAGADLAFKKVDSLLRGNTYDEVDWLARAGGFRGLALVPAFPAQARVTEGGQQWWLQPGGERRAVAESIADALRQRGWTVATGAQPPVPGSEPVAWVPDVRDDAEMDRVAAQALGQAQPWLWCGSAGLAQALARSGAWPVPAAALAPASGRVMLVSASHHAVSREQWQRLNASAHAADCHRGDDPATLAHPAEGYPALIDLSAREWLTPEQAAGLLERQALALAAHAPRPGTLVVVGGDTLLALCRALGATGLRSGVPMARPGWGCARMVGGRWDGLVCHTRSGAFGGPQDLIEVVAGLSV